MSKGCYPLTVTEQKFAEIMQSRLDDFQEECQDCDKVFCRLCDEPCDCVKQNYVLIPYSCGKVVRATMKALKNLDLKKLKEIL